MTLMHEALSHEVSDQVALSLVDEYSAWAMLIDAAQYILATSSSRGGIDEAHEARVRCLELAQEVAACQGIDEDSEECSEYRAMCFDRVWMLRAQCLI